MTVPEILMGLDGFKLGRALDYNLNTLQLSVPLTMVYLARGSSLVHNIDPFALPDTTLCRKSDNDMSQCKRIDSKRWRVGPERVDR